MRRPPVLLFLLLPLLPLLLLLPCASSAADDVAPAALIAAAKKATLSEIDYTRSDCHDVRTVEAWLGSVVGRSAIAIKWTSGACQLANKQNPIDAGTDWCAQAEITPKSTTKSTRRPGDKATIEIYFERPKGGRPGQAFAFRGVVNTKDGWDYVRDTSAFAADWRETYAPDEPKREADDCR